MIRLNDRISKALCLLGIICPLLIAGCSQSLPTSTNAPNDPAGMGTPQERMEKLKANTMMDPRLKARKMRILQDQIDGTHTAPGKN